jgi:hypothetical protein
MEYKKTSLANLLTTSPILREIVYKVEQLAKLNQLVLKKLDPTLARHCRVANFRNGILVLTTTSPIWGHQLRFAKTDILSTLRADPEWIGLKSIEAQVRPDTNSVADIKKNTLPVPKLSKVAAQFVELTAIEVTSPTLKKALLKLSKRAE